jgi:DNA-binding beta-propeller fold protein YncE
VTTWGRLGSGNGQFRFPHGVAVDGQDTVYVADRDNHRIQQFTSSGSFLRKWGSRGSNIGQFDSPWGIAVDDLGNVYVADSFNDRIQRFDPAS